MPFSQELANTSEWMRSNKLSLDASKSEFLIVGHTWQLNSIQQPVQLKIGDDSIRVQRVEYHGLAVDENLTCTEQYKVSRTKLNVGYPKFGN